MRNFAGTCDGHVHLRVASLMAPVHFLQQEFLVGGRDVEALARLVDEVRRPLSLLGEPRERTAQRFVRRHDGRERHGVIVRPQARESGHDESLRTAVAVDGARGAGHRESRQLDAVHLRCDPLQDVHARDTSPPIR